MKDTYLLIYTRYKFLIFSVYTLISAFGIFVQYIKEVLSISSVLVIFSSTFFAYMLGLMELLPLYLL